MTPNEEEIRAAIAQQAGEWFVANRAGTLDYTQRAAFVSWLKASPIHVEEYLGVALIARDLHAAADDPELERLVEAARADQSGNVVSLDLSLPSRSHPDTRSRISRAWPLLATAAAAALAGVAFLLWPQRHSEPQEPAQRYATAHGEQTNTRLPDGSVLYLNTDSAVTVRYSSVERVVDVERGQALFQVVHDAARRFRVSAGEAHVIAVGTQFEVYRKLDTTFVTVVEGSVAVVAGEPPLNPARVALPAPRPERATQRAGPVLPGARHLDAGFQLRVDAGVMSAQAQPIDLAQATGWLQGKIAFEQRPLGEVADEFNRYARIPLEVTDPALRALPISGMFDAHDMDSFVAFLETLDGVSVQRTATRILVFSLRR